jgi:Ca2+/Na+ antiporter
MLWLAVVLVVLVPLLIAAISWLGHMGRLAGMLILLACCCLLIVAVMGLVSALRTRGNDPGTQENVTERKTRNLARFVFAILAGFLVDIAVGIATTPVLPTFFLRQLVPTLVGGCVAGLIAGRRGWLCGLISAVLDQTFLTVFAFWAFSWYAGWQGVLEVAIRGWYSTFVALCAGTAGGYAGQLLCAVRGRGPSYWK